MTHLPGVFFDRRARAAAWAGAAAALLTAGAAPAQDIEALVAAAKAEGQLMLYSSQAESQTQALLDAFERAYGIKGTFLRLTTTPLVQRFATEVGSGAPEADILSVTTPTPYDDNPGWFLPLTPQAVPSLTTWPGRWVNPHSVVYTTDTMVAVYNTDQVGEADAPKTWRDLVDDRWAGQIAFTDPRGSENYLGWLDAMEREHGIEYLKKLGSLNYTLTQSGASGAQMVAAGAQSLNFPSFPSFIVPLRQAGAPVVAHVITEPTVVSPRLMAATADAPHPHAARLFLHWLLSEEGMRAACAAISLPVAGDPEGKLGCVPTADPQPIAYAIPQERIRTLLEAVGLSPN